MRIIAGELGGRLFQAPRGHRTHPMSDKMRGALFNMLGDISGSEILDAFAGSGALSFEAISRGANAALAIEADRDAQQAIRSNIAMLDVSQQVKLVSARCGAWLRTSEQQFDIVLLDPPYDDLQLPILQQLTERVRPGGLMVLSWPGKQPVIELTGLTLVRSKSYGDGSLHLFQRP